MEKIDLHKRDHAVAANERVRDTLLCSEPPLAVVERSVPPRTAPALLARLLHASGADERRRAVAAFTRELGFEWLSYGRVQVARGTVTPIACYCAHADAEWERRYLAESYHTVDPRLALALCSSLPVSWDIATLLRDAGGTDLPRRCFLHALQSTGARWGVTLLLPDVLPHERTLIHLVARSEPPADGGSDALVGQVLTLGMCVHEFYGCYALAPLASAEEMSMLSRTQHAILQCVARGLPDKRIASTLDISPHTVDYHLRQLRKRFNARNRVQLAHAALRETQAARPERAAPAGC